MEHLGGGRALIHTLGEVCTLFSGVSPLAKTNGSGTYLFL